MTGTAMTGAAVVVAVLMLATWAVSLVRRDASIVDVAWGLGFVAVARTTSALVDGNPTRQWLLVALTTIWGLRLAAYLWWRNRGQPEDDRYRAMRRPAGTRCPLVSLVKVFAVQGLLMWVVSLPVQLGQVPTDTGLGPLAWLAARPRRRGRRRMVGHRRCRDHVRAPTQRLGRRSARTLTGQAQAWLRRVHRQDLAIPPAPTENHRPKLNP